MRITGQVIFGTGILIGEIAPPATRDTDFLGQPERMVYQHHRPSALASFHSAHHPRRTGANDHDIHVHINSCRSGFVMALLMTLRILHLESDKTR